MFALVLFVVAGFGFVRQVNAQTALSLVGQWQGTTEGAKPGRVVLKIEPAGGNAQSGIVYLLDGDNASRPHATTSLVLRGAGITFQLANIEVTYTGKVSSDGVSMTGVWTQHGTSASLNLAHVSGDKAWEIPSMSKSMAATASPSFDFATIKPADPQDTSRGFQLNGDRFRARNETMMAIVAFAYGVHRKQILDAPSWFDSELWDIQGIADTPGMPNLKQMRAMYRKLLTERLMLKIDLQKREIPVYAIELGKETPKLTRSRAEQNGLPDSTGSMNGGRNDMRYTNISMDEFATDLGFTEDRPLVNETSLPGRYDFRLRWSSADTQSSSDTDAPPVLFTAIQEQLGLRVEAMRAPADVYVIAHVERPSAN